MDHRVKPGGDEVGEAASPYSHSSALAIFAP
jgi:hypothetical protein